MNIHDGPILSDNWTDIRIAIECGHHINYWHLKRWQIALGGVYRRLNIATVLKLSQLNVIEKYADMDTRWRKAAR